MKILIWLVCVVVYSALVLVLQYAGVTLGGIPVALLSFLFVFLPAPALCRALDRRKAGAAAPPPESDAGAVDDKGELPAAPAGRLSRFFKSLSTGRILAAVLVLFVMVSLSVVSYEKGVKEGQAFGYDEGNGDGKEAGYEEGYTEGWDAGYDCGQEDGFTEGRALYAAEVYFFRSGACIVTTTGDKYHHWGCYHIGDSSYWIYNVELAEAKGYAPCLDCWEQGLENLPLPPLAQKGAW